MIDQNLLMNDLLHVSGADRVVLQEDISVKDNALVDTILGNSTVQDSTMHKNGIPGSGRKAFFCLK